MVHHRSAGSVCWGALLVAPLACAPGPIVAPDTGALSHRGSPRGETPEHAPVEPVENVDSNSLASVLDRKRDEGLVLEDLQIGTGQSVEMGDEVKVHYVGRLEDGTEFDSSRNRPGAFAFTLGKGMVIRGFERGMIGMRVGGVRRIRIPWRLAYGEQGSPPRIPSKANLIFEIELLDLPVPPAKSAPKGPASPPSAPQQ